MPTTPENNSGNIYAAYAGKSAREKRNQLLQFPGSHAFVIGINHYPDLKAPLQSAVPDAEKLASVLWDEQGFDHVWLIRNVKGAELRALLDWIGKKGAGSLPAALTPQVINEKTAPGARQLIEGNPVNRFIHYTTEQQPVAVTDARSLLQKGRQSAEADPVNRPRPHAVPKNPAGISPDDSLVFYYAGHGKAGEFDKGPSGYLLPSDAKPSNAVLENDSLVPMDDLLTALQDAGCKHTLLILDCCFAGKFRYAVNTHRDVVQTELRPMYAERFERYKREAAWQVLVSAGPDQTAADWMGDRADETGSDRNPHSPFALALFEALAGKAEVKPAGKGLGDGVLTASELKLYLYDQVEKKTQADPDFKAQYPDLFPMEGHKGGEFIFFDPTNRLNFPERAVKNPYKGLKSYETDDADIFFGRRASIDAAMEFLDAGAGAMVITAPSGIGKSSFAKAGLFPRMQNDRGYATLLQMRPGRLPKTALDKIDFDPRAKQILLIDQFEELYTLCTDKDERKAFETALADHFERIKNPGSKARIWITIRSDYELKLKSSPLGQQLFGTKDGQFSLFRLAPLNLDQLREALTGPALLEAYEFESPQLADRILQDIHFAPGALPLMSLAMKWLFQGVENLRAKTDADVRIFKEDHYRLLGGVDGCISKMANAVYAGLPDETHREMMRKILLRMVQLQGGGFVRRRVYLDPFINPAT
ncbi:MAG TPA: caspase family protein, partial [Flavilitoribacter sp.]|nr:caspase family protein [Flavilitoribacter sp.]